MTRRPDWRDVTAGVVASVALHGAALAGILIWAPAPPVAEIAPATVIEVTLSAARDSETSGPLLAPSGSRPDAAPPPPVSAPLAAIAPPAAAPRPPAPSTRKSLAASAHPAAAPLIRPAMTAPAAPTAASAGNDDGAVSPSPGPAAGSASDPVAGPASGSGTDRAGTAPSAAGADQTARPLPGNSPPVYPSSARRAGREGRTVLRVVVAEDGGCRDARIEESSGWPALDEAALAAVRDWRFSPARRSGAAIEATVRVPVTFRLKDVP